ncbi:MAG: hypothetical protein IJW73_07800 [Candidatus Gastranaerophilales bacterium]|nr:hypothetical protein [Candidatus Gastranaerophilales bacterium]
MDDKKAKRVLDHLEDDLSHFLIKERCKSDPTKRSSAEMYKYRGLSIILNPKSKRNEKTIFVRIGVLEAEFRLDSCEKNSGCLAPEDEKIVRRWLEQGDNSTKLNHVFEKRFFASDTPPVVPFDLESFYAS